MIHMTEWTVSVQLTEIDGRTHATAVLHNGAVRELTGRGSARKAPADVDVPEIGDELAAARALAELSQQLVEAAATDIEGMTRLPVRVNS
jgi:uncharacterized protein DUF1876